MDGNRKVGGVGRSVALWLALPAAAAGTGGCGWFGGGGGGAQPARPLRAEQFVGDQYVAPGGSDGGRIPGNPIERGGVVNVDSNQIPIRRGLRERPDVSADPGPNTTRLSPTVSDTVRGPVRPGSGALPTTTRIDLAGDPAEIRRPAATTRPASGNADLGGPRAVDVGFVVMEVNGKPIYSDKVLQALERPLATEAKQAANPDQFREKARLLLEQQIRLFVRDELEVAAAERALEPADKSLAQALTAQWRQQQITAAGGSIEQARQKAREDGWDFEDLVQQQYRLKLVQIFYQKRIYPRIQVAASDVRNYYERNQATEFSKPGRLKFRVAKVDPRKFVSRDEAFVAAEKLRDRAKDGADFAKLADEVNGDGRGGVVGGPDAGGWVDANSYRYEDVEKAAGKLRPGQVTDVIQTGGQLFVAKLEEIQDAKAQSFEEQAVQEKINQKLRGLQLGKLREEHVARLSEIAVIRENPGKKDDLLGIVLQRYGEWAKAG